MARICDRCGKGNLQGRQVSFSGKRAPKVFRPNLHFAWVIESGQRVRRRFCTKCLRIVKGKARLTESLDSPAQTVAS